MNRFFLKKHSSLNALSFAQGGDSYQQESIVSFEDEHGFASLKGLNVLSGKSRIIQRATANHLKPHCASRQFYKNILSDDAKSEFDSLVFVDKNAVKSDSRQLNKNLLLSDKAQADTRPQLRIDNDDVSCNHGATVGQMEKDELFYLRSRGLKEEFARFILTYGFAEEILEELKPDYLREQLDRIVKDEIQKALK
jgi:Fe-S cluster assembly protein SufD